MSYTRLDDLYSLHNRLVDDYNDPDKPFEQTEEDRLLTYDLIEKIENGQLVEFSFAPLTIEQVKALKKGEWIWIEIYIRREIDKVKNGYAYIRYEINNEVLAFLLHGCFWTMPYADYGKTWIVYKTQEAAEARLKELQEGRI